MSDADLAAVAETVFETECDRIHDAVLAALKPPNLAGMPHGRLMLHHHAVLAVLSQFIFDYLTMIPDAQMRKDLHTGVLTVITPDPRSKELH